MEIFCYLEKKKFVCKLKKDNKKIRHEITKKLPKGSKRKWLNLISGKKITFSVDVGKQSLGQQEI